MLAFLFIAAKRGFLVDSYRDEAVGILAMDSSGKLAMMRVTLRPEADFTGDKGPTADDIGFDRPLNGVRCGAH